MAYLRPFQRRFLAKALAPGIDTAALSLPRGNGKSWLAAHILTRCLTPTDSLHVSGSEYLLCAASIDQARIVFRFVREALEPSGEFRFIDSATRLGIHHKETATRLKVLSSNGRTAMGIVGTRILVADEPGSWEVNGGLLMHDALATASGKPFSPLKVVYIGTLAPAVSGWWHDMIADGTHGSTYVQALQGDPKTWDSFHTIRKANPLVEVSPEFRRKLLEERDAARNDSRLKARFLSYRLNVPTGDSSTMLLTVDDWQRIEAREVPPREGKPLVGVDLGGGRAWSAACAMYRNGRTEALAVAPGLPNLRAQEKRDRVARGLYSMLAESGRLRVAEGLRVQPVGQLWEMIRQTWGKVEVVICDRNRLAELQDAIKGAVPLVPRVTRWFEASSDIRALRKYAMDGPLCVEPSSRPLLQASLAVAQVKNDDQGNTRLAKTGTNNTARDDVAAAWVLVAGLLERSKPKAPTWKYHGMAG